MRSSQSDSKAVQKYLRDLQNAVKTAKEEAEARIAEYKEKHPAKDPYAAPGSVEGADRQAKLATATQFVTQLNAALTLLDLYYEAPQNLQTQRSYAQDEAKSKVVRSAARSRILETHLPRIGALLGEETGALTMLVRSDTPVGNTQGTLTTEAFARLLVSSLVTQQKAVSEKVAKKTVRGDSFKPVSDSITSQVAAIKEKAQYDASLQPELATRPARKIGSEEVAAIRTECTPKAEKKAPAEKAAPTDGNSSSNKAQAEKMRQDILDMLDTILDGNANKTTAIAEIKNLLDYAVVLVSKGDKWYAPLSCYTQTGYSKGIDTLNTFSDAAATTLNGKRTDTKSTVFEETFKRKLNTDEKKDTFDRVTRKRGSFFFCCSSRGGETNTRVEAVEQALNISLRS